MATKEQETNLKQTISNVLDSANRELVSRSEWGSITFNNAEHDLNRIRSVLEHLNILPLEYLTDDAVTSVENATNTIAPILDKIDQFSVESPNPSKVRDQYVTEIHQASEKLYAEAAKWIPFLAYQKGDVAENIARLTATITEAEALADKSKNDIQEKAKEIETIIIKTREASAEAGAAVFTKDFENEARDNRKQARWWLGVTACFAVITIVVSFWLWRWAEGGLDTGQIWQKLGSRIFTVSILLTATLWCGKIYKALLHQATVNKHRALSLKTFQAFSAAASDEQTKNAVLLETTRSIFSSVATGYVDARSSDEGDSRIIEIAKTISER